jgi:glyoxylase-like metal-dependent hydrolase (beta-lactamase superfamily II)
MASLIILGILALFLLYMLSRLRPSPTRQIDENLYVVRCGFVNFYALRANTGVILFDAGISPGMAKRGLQKVGISADEVTHVFLTHTDYDHAGGLKAFPGAMTYISTGEEQMIDGRKARRGPLHNARLTSYQTLENGETVAIGDTAVELRLTPGHTAGSSIYRIGRDVFATGDLLWYSRKGEALPCIRLMNMDHRIEVKNVKASAGIIEGAGYILTGHTGVHGLKCKE